MINCGMHYAIVAASAAAAAFNVFSRVVKHFVAGKIGVSYVEIRSPYAKKMRIIKSAGKREHCEPT